MGHKIVVWHPIRYKDYGELGIVELYSTEGYISYDLLLTNALYTYNTTVSSITVICKCMHSFHFNVTVSSASGTTVLPSNE